MKVFLFVRKLMVGAPRFIGSTFTCRNRSPVSDDLASFSRAATHAAIVATGMPRRRAASLYSTELASRAALHSPGSYGLTDFQMTSSQAVLGPAVQDWPPSADPRSCIAPPLDAGNRTTGPANGEAIR